jgi:hypothetical protein
MSLPGYDAWLEPPDDDSCERCEDDPAMDHADCIEAARDAHDDHLIDQEEARRDAILDDGPGPGWEP